MSTGRMGFSRNSAWDWFQRIALILGALASLVVIVEFPKGSGPDKPAPPGVVEKPTPPASKPLPPAPEPTAAPLAAEPVPALVYRTRSGERYHRPSCRHVRGKAIPLSLAQAEEMGLTPCGTCNPDR